MAEERTLYVTHFDEKVTKELLQEIFTQVGPVESVSVIKGTATYAFVQFEDEESVLFAIKLMDGLKLFNTPICVRPRAKTEKDRIYRQQNPDSRHSSAGPSRRESGNDYLPTHHSYSGDRRRSLNEDIPRKDAGLSRRESYDVPAFHPEHGRRSFNENFTRQNTWFSRKHSMDVYQTQPSRRSLNESYPPIPLRLIQPHGQYPLNAFSSPSDPYRQRITGGQQYHIPSAQTLNRPPKQPHRAPPRQRCFYSSRRYNDETRR
jgi:RNA recognition motif-containing protein